VEILGALSRFKLGFVGLLASRQRVKDDLQALRAQGYPEKFIESIRAPVGADIGAVTPSEIALSIISDIVATKYGKELPHKDVKQPASLRTPERG